MEKLKLCKTFYFWHVASSSIGTINIRLKQLKSSSRGGEYPQSLQDGSKSISIE